MEIEDKNFQTKKRQFIECVILTIIKKGRIIIVNKK